MIYAVGRSHSVAAFWTVLLHRRHLFKSVPCAPSRWQDQRARR